MNGGTPTGTGGPEGDRAPPPGLSGSLIYGMENFVTGHRNIADNHEEAQALLRMGWQVLRIFRDRGTATTWMEQARPKVHCQTCASCHAPPQCGDSVRPTARRMEPALRPEPEKGATDGPGTAAKRGPEPPKVRASYGMENPATGDRIVAHGRDEVSLLKDTGFALRKLFYDQDDSLRWSREQDTRLVMDTARRAAGGPRHVSKVGPDPSSNEREVFEVNIDQVKELDQMVLPSGTPAAEADDYCDCAADVLALPGGYKSGFTEAEEDHGDVAKASLTMATGRREAGLHMRFNARSQNGLRLIRGESDLAEFIESVHEGWQCAKQTMHSQFTRRMYQGGHGTDSIEAYLQNGVLPRIVEDTRTGYAHLLTTLAGYVSKMAPGEG